MTADDLVDPWHLAEDEKDISTAIEALPGAMEFGNSMEVTSDGHISWYIGADGTYMDCIERRFIYNGTDTWTDEDGGVEIVSFENVNISYPEHTHIEPCVISGVKIFELISVKS